MDIKLENIYKTYGTKEVLKGVDISFQENTITSIFGLSGSGKSTTIKLIAGIEKPTSGNVLIDNDNVSEMSYKNLRELRKNIGFVFQESALFDSISIYENLAFPLKERKYKKDYIEEAVNEIIELVKMKKSDLDKYPDELSGGMKKRVGLARAIITNPKIVLYDEPTSGLDPITSAHITQLIIDMQKRFKNTSILISHNVEEVLSSDNVAVLYDGKIIEYASSQAIRNSINPYTQQMLKGSLEGPIS